ncbi:hypothetical protein VOLCADRAFT_57730 [Volvox carteri f. nagariensis]|uniref:Glycosyltransferase subfamily 4-like N-terminal domain-containing protein n=1 Tax=Volvox carteri f. nagariensis TaxID=3068 RepID=D8TNV0_VOLCA|nr:uncharacterized protein VOLCADRAFT_57730 [Volvox carteri f. nagariensis]EFJ50907.1 hypothetical protein VOLCADRAFT_57730 [Volvox carteri f. nagariensis]|eukprot:XP_002947919.1 hypothetical protein VOLCADRAFT_57730 [Volvox carteri f. nagariensis]
MDDTSRATRSRHVHWVIVLGDFGRSPRMQYHTVSLSRQTLTDVHVVAYGGAAPLQELVSASNVHIHNVVELPLWLQRLPRVLFLVLKVLYQLLGLLWMMLIQLPSPGHILMQNPPAIPTMAVCWLAALRHRAKLVIDWHNYGYSILALSQGQRHPLVALAHSYERFWGKRGNAHFCVTKAMQEDLQRKWGIRATVLYDRPPAFFKRTGLPVLHTLFRKLGPTLEQPAFDDFLARRTSQVASSRTQESAEVTVVSVKRSGQAASLRPDRPAVVVSSTSWTPDEDFSILLDAAVRYDQLASESAPGEGSGSNAGDMLPDLLLLITGKGPQKDMYLSRIASMSFKKVAIRALWLEANDYPLLLGAADVGVSLHASSSGLDLPMKVVDMYGSGLPVCALSYSCITELVAPGKTGLLFSSGDELATQLANLLKGFPNAPSAQLTELKRNVAACEQGLRWEENWQRVAGPVLGYQSG